MAQSQPNQLFSEEVIVEKIFVIKGQKIMLDNDLAEMYGVATARLNEEVKRNITRFPGDFMFQLSTEEWNNLKSQFDFKKTRNQKIAFLLLPNRALPCFHPFCDPKEQYR